MKLHEDIKVFEDAVKITAQQLGVAEIHIKKDYWVTLALHTIFKSTMGIETVFKGGTAFIYINDELFFRKEPCGS